MTSAFGAAARRRGAAAGPSAVSRRTFVLALALAVAACASPSAPRYHTLLANERPAPLPGAAADTGPAVFIEPVHVPTQVDQPQWLVRLPDESLALLEQERWASPLRDEIRLALREILTRRFGAVETRAVGPTTPLWRVRVEVTRFESLPGEARLDVTWNLTPRGSDAAGLRCSTFVRESAGGGMPALAEAHRRAVARVGEAIGEQLLALQRGEKGRCPG
jgi:hypothetical protein